MRTLFLLGILCALVVIATKRNDQTAIEAALEIGNRAQNMASKYQGATTQEKDVGELEKVKKTVPKKANPFFRQVEKAIAKTEASNPKKPPKAHKNQPEKKTVRPVVQKPNARNKVPQKEPEWTLPKPRQLAMPDIPAMPKSRVDVRDLNAETPVELANAKPAAVDIGQSYNLVKGYYENASRLLEEIK
jgi:hypothetical protein